MRSSRSLLLRVTLLSLVLCISSLIASAVPGPGSARDGVQARQEPRPPIQPPAGPGGLRVTFPRVEHLRVGEMPTGGWLFIPADEAGIAPASGPLPLVIFFHGFTALNPGRYLSWINHLAMNGAVVFYPDYQDTNFGEQEPTAYLPQALAGIQAAVELLGTGELPAVDANRVAVVGHSLGGVLAANYAAVSGARGLPVPRALMPVQPGGCAGCGGTGDRLGVPLVDLSSVPTAILGLVVTGADDTIVADFGAKLIWSGLIQVPLDQRDYVIFPSDGHGDPPLVSDHLMPQTAGTFSEVDALDWLGLWKLFDSLMACAFTGEWCDVALGDTDEQRYLGQWSDSVPVNPLIVTDRPS